VIDETIIHYHILAKRRAVSTGEGVAHRTQIGKVWYGFFRQFDTGRAFRPEAEYMPIMRISSPYSVIGGWINPAAFGSERQNLVSFSWICICRFMTAWLSCELIKTGSRGAAARSIDLGGSSGP